MAGTLTLRFSLILCVSVVLASWNGGCSRRFRVQTTRPCAYIGGEPAGHRRVWC
jgi:hypothetical protein